MPGHVVMAIEGVLRNYRGQPIPEGIALYVALQNTHKIVLVADTLDAETVAHWLKVERLKEHTKVLVGGTRPRQIEALRAADSPVTLLVDADPHNVARALATGVTGLLFAAPKYLRPEHMPVPGEVRPWSEIADEMDRQAQMRADDPRLGELVEQLTD